MVLPTAEDIAAGLSRMLEDSTLRERLAAAGQKTAQERFAVKAMLDAYERLYQPHSA
jgi:glycosyltransferase involved in cell wall biosynthesis